MCFIDNHQVPPGGDQIFKALAVVCGHLCSRPATTTVDGLHRIHGTDNLRVTAPEVVVRNNVAVGGEVAGDEQPELFTKMRAHLGYPLRHQPFRSDYQSACDQTAQSEFAHDEPGFDGLPKAYFIGEEIPYSVTGDGAR